MKIWEVPKDQIKVGDNVVSYRGRPGVIIYAQMQRWFSVGIEWSIESPWDKEKQKQSHFYLYGDEISSEKDIEYKGQ